MNVRGDNFFQGDSHASDTVTLLNPNKCCLEVLKFLDTKTNKNAFWVGTSISYVKQVTVIHDKNCDRKFEFRYEIVFWLLLDSS